MKTRSLVLFLVMAVLFPTVMSAQFTAMTRLAMKRDALREKTMAGKPEQQLRCFVEVASADDLARLKAAGVTVDARFGTLATVRIPRHLLPKMASITGVRRVALAQPMTLTNDSARIEGHVNPVHIGENLPQAFRGRGVVIGIIDTGVDFNHINFLDAQGRNRISRVYMPQDSTGQSPVVDGDTLPGSHYTTPGQIAALTTDTPRTLWALRQAVLRVMDIMELLPRPIWWSVACRCSMTPISPTPSATSLTMPTVCIVRQW